MISKAPEKTQVTVRLSADVVAHIDELVESGATSSRAAYLDHAARRQRQIEIAERDAVILQGFAPDADESALVAWLGSRDLPELD